MKHGHRMSTDGDDEWARIIIICTLALARPVCAGFLCAAPYGFLGSSPNSCRHAWGHKVAVLAIYRCSTMAQTGVSGPVVVDGESFLDALFASAGQV
jgi:hypothetical protein